MIRVSGFCGLPGSAQAPDAVTAPPDPRLDPRATCRQVMQGLRRRIDLIVMAPIREREQLSDKGTQPRRLGGQMNLPRFEPSGLS